MNTPLFLSFIKSDIQEFDARFKKELSSKKSLLSLITSYILKTKGKQIRPSLVFLSARLIGSVTEASYSAAFMIELMHTATLLHDDVVDNSMKRRGFFSVNALWKNKISVLVGDYLLAKGLLHAIETNHIELLKIISTAVKDMSEGELLQIEKAKLVSNSEDIYFQIIEKKTASLFVAAMLSGAHSTGNLQEKDAEKLKKIALLLGVAFQIKDDVLDYSKTSVIGKPIWNDLKEKKITLPLLHALKQVSKKEQLHIKKLLKGHKNNPKKLQEIVNFIMQHNGIEYAEAKIEELCSEAKQIVYTFSHNEAQEALVSLIDYICTRKK
ncbi:MAG: polyprenyl synthetase family protein [Bacteroidales bacterium]|jgi:octaprenyl-diphosphate synthase|nr:polyprenyl synthetase family protein [Bacteroidales bacterium]NLK81992.1 polyprenyl synthetase family protein [Bacteroidales bacterium]HPY81892.1 polyprenyl synthetase family protein [Bacteroidales bacterium]